MSNASKSFIENMLEVDADRRPTAAAALRHCWIREFGSARDDVLHRSGDLKVDGLVDRYMATQQREEAAEIVTAPREDFTNIGPEPRALASFPSQYKDTHGNLDSSATSLSTPPQWRVDMEVSDLPSPTSSKLRRPSIPRLNTNHRGRSPLLRPLPIHSPSPPPSKRGTKLQRKSNPLPILPDRKRAPKEAPPLKPSESPPFPLNLVTIPPVP